VFFFQAEDGIRDKLVTGVQTCALPISRPRPGLRRREAPRTTRAAARRARLPDARAGTHRCLVRAVSEMAPPIPKPRAWVDSRLASLLALFHETRHTPTEGLR